MTSCAALRAKRVGAIESAQVLSSMRSRGHFCISGGRHMRLPLSLSLTAAGFFRCRAPPPTNPPPSSAHPRALLPRDCSILRPRAGLLLSRACDPHPCDTLLAVACLCRDRSSALQASCSRLWSHISMLPNARMQPKPLNTSLLFAGWSRRSSNV